MALLLALTVQTEPVQDFKTMYEAAQDLAHGGRSYLQNQYFSDWAYQTGFVAYEAAVLKIFGSEMALRVFNALFMGGTAVIFYFIAKRMLGPRCAMIISILYVFYPGPYMLASVLTNQHIATFCLYLGILFFIRANGKSRPFLWVSLAGVSIAVGNVMRPIGVLVVIAFLCWEVYRMLSVPQKGRLKVLMILAVFCTVYSIAYGGMDIAIKVSGINPEGLANNRPLWKFILGFSQSSAGGWNRADYERFVLPPLEGAIPAMKEELFNRIRISPVEFIRLQWQKCEVLWAIPEESFWGFGHMDMGRALFGGLTVGQFINVILYIDRGICLCTFVLCFLGLLSLWKKKTDGLNIPLLLVLLVCAYAGVHIFIEVQTRYRYFLMPSIFLLAGCGLKWLGGGRRFSKFTPVSASKTEGGCEEG